MLRRDYIQKMIEEFARAIASAMKLNDEGRSAEALKSLQESYAQFFSEDAQMIRLLQPSQLLKKLVTVDGLTTGQIEILAQGLRTEADLLLSTSPEDAKDRYVKSLALYEYVELNDVSNYSIARKHAIEEIRFSISAL